MQLIGLLDSPYVRRVAISMQWLGLAYDHQPLSVFRTFDAFQAINPVVKAPTLVCDDGQVLMDSGLILTYVEALAHPRSLMPTDLDALRDDLRIIGLALAVCEKSIQIYYERTLRPAEKRHAPWLERITGQLLAACDGLEETLETRPLPVKTETITQASITTAVAWYFTQQMVTDVVPAGSYPALVALSAQAEALPAFLAAPFGGALAASSLAATPQ